MVQRAQSEMLVLRELPVHRDLLEVQDNLDPMDSRVSLVYLVIPDTRDLPAPLELKE